MSGSTMTSVYLYAGNDLYTILHIPADLQGNREGMYQAVLQQVQSRLEDDFGPGVELMQDLTPQIYNINTDRVLIQ